MKKLVIGLCLVFGIFTINLEAKMRSYVDNLSDSQKEWILEQIGDITDKTSNYVVIFYKYADFVEFAVSEYMKHGYIPVGGMTRSCVIESMFIQAVYRPIK